MIGGTSGSDANACQPSASQSKITQTRLSSFGSRNTCAPLEPCWRRFSAPFVEKIRSKRSKSSTVVVARNMCASCGCSAPRSGVDVGGEYLTRPARPHRANSLCRVHELLLEGPHRRGCAGPDSGLFVDVLDVMSGGLHRDPQGVGDPLVGGAANEREQHLELARREPCGQLAGTLRDPVAGGREHGADGVRVEPALACVAQELG